MTLGITGHTNIEKCFNFPLLENGEIYNERAFETVYKEIATSVSDFCIESNVNTRNLTLVSGMCRGIDELFALFAIQNNLSLILSIPNSIKWHSDRPYSRGIRAQAIYYDKILSYNKIIKINEIKKVYNGKTYQFANFARNQNIVDESDILFAYKRYNSTGTDNCIELAKKSKKEIIFI